MYNFLTILFIIPLILCLIVVILTLSYLRDIYVSPTKKFITFKQIILSTSTLACFKEESSSYM